eukprot:CAMPEP_0174319052 /NCGR_PEP_ID=MMETSP0810-20121108/8608_1 /TAXON_ID=73025 ORGANISM="Eutreptiella gymnastica-like, Strain CCMP1594" /NCGR_SAMPLE_ID=MMETSP0810 /ASSEMBLY_ACC=CAM_ASM_000659 /LENGTH=101 /DNA_ID=CAMNT_0015429467 /DNA_START=1218 /DNA_END=1519 /DNA_ORIENTATION=+
MTCSPCTVGISHYSLVEHWNRAAKCPMPSTMLQTTDGPSATSGGRNGAQACSGHLGYKTQRNRQTIDHTLKSVEKEQRQEKPRFARSVVVAQACCCTCRGR